MSAVVFSVPKKSASGASIGQVDIPADRVDERVRIRLLKEAIVMYRANRRQGTHSTKTRGEVAYSTKKLWRQKGTGRARPGSKRNPIWRGGGTIFGPKPRDYSYSINRKQKQRATRSALLAKLQAGQVIVVDDLRLDAPRTKTVARALSALGVDGRCLIGTGEIDSNLVLSVRNLPKVRVLPLRDFNAEEILLASTVILTSSAVDLLLADPLPTDDEVEVEGDSGAEAPQADGAAAGAAGSDEESE